MTSLFTHPTKQALLHFISAARAGRVESATTQQKAAFRLASLLQEMGSDLSSLTNSESAGFLELARLSSGRPISDDQKIRASMLVAAAVTPPDETNTENLPTWKRMQIKTKLIQQLVEEICDRAPTTIGGKSREGFNPQIHTLF